MHEQVHPPSYALGGEDVNDRHVAVLILLSAIAYLVSAFQLPSLEIGDPLGPKVFPILLGIGLVGSALLLISEGKGRPVQTYFKQEKQHLILIGAVVLMTFVYILLFETLGFILINSIFLLLLLAYFHRKHWLKNSFIAILFTIAVYSLFAKFLGVTLAKGILYF